MDNWVVTYSTNLFYCNTWLNLISPSIFAQISISIPFLNSSGNSAFKTAQDIEFWWTIKGVMSRKPKKTKIQKHQIYGWDFSWYAHSCPSEKWQKSENCLKMDIFFLSIWMLQKLSYLIFILWEGVIKDSDNFFFFSILSETFTMKSPIYRFGVYEFWLSLVFCS